MRIWRSVIRPLSPQYLPGLGLGELPLLPGDRAVDDGVLDALRRHDDALGAARQIVAALAVVVRELAHTVLARVPRGHGQLALEIVGQDQVEEGIDAVLALLLGDLRHRLA